MLLRSLLALLVCLSLAYAATPAPAAEVQLAWDAPMQADGTPVLNVAGYKLYSGSQSGQYQTVVPVGLTTTYTVKDVSTGQTYYFAVQAYDSTGAESAFSDEISVTLSTNSLSTNTIPQQRMRVVSADSQERVGENGAVTNALDGKSATFWHTEWSRQKAPLPHTLVLDLGSQYQVNGFRYLPRQDGGSNGTIAGYEFYVSPDRTTWGPAVAAGTFAANTSEKIVRFTAKTGRYVRLVAVSEINGKPYTSVAELNGKPYTSVAELNIFGTAAQSSTTTASSLPAPSVTTAPVTSSTSTTTPSQNTPGK